MKIDEEIEILKQNTVDFISEEDMKKKLLCKQRLKIKLGFDPTSPDIHIGHMVVLNKLRKFQQLGHSICLIIGDFTASIGDPTGKNITRKPLDREEIIENAKTYKKQIFKILDNSNIDILFNSDWINKFKPSELIALTSKYTIARMIERDDFHERYKNNSPIHIHEFIYPLLQGYDSVHLNADVEIGGTDQKFNLLVGRDLQKIFGQKPQVIITMPIIEGLDGIKKMSKSLNNYIGITEDPLSIFGKIMSVSDELMWKYINFIGLFSTSEINFLNKNNESGENKKNIKVKLAKRLISKLYSNYDANYAEKEFFNFFKNKIVPENINTFEFNIKKNERINVATLLKKLKFVSSTSEFFRLVKQRGIRLDNEIIEDKTLDIYKKGEYIFQSGKFNLIKIILK